VEQFVQEGCNQCLQAELDYVVFSRNDAASSFEWVVVFSGGVGGQRIGVASSSHSFCACDSWWVQDNLATFRTCSAVFCIDNLIFGERGSGKKRKGNCWGSVV
jgi:hypothetical protein